MRTERFGLTVSMDPGLRACGIGIFYERILIRAMLVQSGVPTRIRDDQAWEVMAEAVCRSLQACIVPPLFLHTFVYENPQTYRRQGYKANVNSDDLKQLRGVNDLVLQKLRKAFGSFRTEKFHPFDWKRTVEKEVMTRRIEAKLSPEEKTKILPCPASLLHNVYDGIGVGLHYVGRKLI